MQSLRAQEVSKGSHCSSINSTIYKCSMPQPEYPGTRCLQESSHVRMATLQPGLTATSPAASNSPNNLMLSRRARPVFSKPWNPHTYHRSKCIASNFSGSFGGNMVGRIWVCLLWGTSAQSSNHCPSLVITCKRGQLSRLKAQPIQRKPWVQGNGPHPVQKKSYSAYARTIHMQRETKTPPQKNAFRIGFFLFLKQD